MEPARDRSDRLRQQLKPVDKSYWRSVLPRPLSPDNQDVDIFKSYLVPGTTLLLGCTRRLIPLSDAQLDIDPWYDAPTVIRGDWRENSRFYTNIIGDGALNFTKELADAVVLMAEKHCANLIVRCFTRRLPSMRIAAYFPQPADLPLPPDIVRRMTDYKFYVWRFG